jgi:hypothetical protein
MHIFVMASHLIAAFHLSSIAFWDCQCARKLVRYHESSSPVCLAVQHRFVLTFTRATVASNTMHAFFSMSLPPQHFRLLE